MVGRDPADPPIQPAAGTADASGVDPLVTPTSVDVAPLHVAGVMLVAAAIGVAGIALARLLEVIVDDGVALGRDLSRRLAVVVLRRRTGMPGNGRSTRARRRP